MNGTGGDVVATGGTTGSGGAATGGMGDAATGGRGGAVTGGRGGAGNDSGGNGVGGSTAPGCPAGAILCDGFEAYPAGASPGADWKPTIRNAGLINIETARPFTGRNALHVTGMMAADRAYLQRPMVTAATTIYVRFMMYTLSYPSSAGVHTRLLRIGTAAGTAVGTAENSYGLASYNGTSIEKINSIYLRSTSTHFNDDALKNRWVCWEFEIDKTGGMGKVVPHIWVDGKELGLSVAGSATHGMTSPSWDPIPIEVIVLGLDGFQPDPVRADFWIDDLIVHSQRAGCPAK